MGLAENLATQNVMPDAVSQATSGVTKGLDAGLAYAQAQQKSNEMGSKIEMMNSQHETQKMSYLMSQLSQISQTPNKSYKNILVKSFSNTHQKFFGTPPSQDMQEFLKNVPEASAGIKKLLEMYPNAAKDPNELLQFKAAYVEMFGGSLSDVPAVAEKMIAQNAKILASEQKGKTTPYQEERLQVQRDKMDDSKHSIAIRALNSNKGISDRINQYSNLENSLATITDAKTLTPQQIMEFQQSVRSNLGIKGTGGVEERDKTYINTLGLDASRLNQFITGDPSSIAKDSKLMKHFIDLANVEMKNISKQTNKALMAVSAGNASMYERRPDLKADLMDKISSMSGRVNQEKSTEQTPTNDGAPVSKPDPSNIAKQFKAAKVDYATFVKRAPNSAKLIDEKTYNSL